MGNGKGGRLETVREVEYCKSRLRYLREWHPMGTYLVCGLIALDGFDTVALSLQRPHRKKLMPARRAA
jgi:hypothetical protein